MADTSRRDSLQQNLAALYLLQAANYVIPVLTLPFLVRAVGLDHFGLIAFAQALAQYFVFAVDSGFNNNAAREIAVNRDRPGAVLEIYWATQAVRGAVLLLSTVLYLLLVLLVPALTAHWELYLLSFMTVLGTFVFSPWLYQGLERMRFIAILHVSGRIVAALALVLLVRAPDDYILAGGIQASATLIAGLLGAVVCARSGMLRWQRPGAAAIRRTVQQGGRLFWSELVGTCVSSSGVFVLGLVASNAVVGAYAAVDKLIRAIMSAYLPISQAFLPRAAAILASTRPGDRSLHRLALLTLAMFAGAVVGAAVISVYAADVLALVFGTSLAGYGGLLALMIWVLPIDTVNVAVGLLFVFAAGYRNEYAHALAIGAAVQCALSLGLVVPLQAFGVVAAFLAAELCMLAMFVHIVLRIRRRAPGLAVAASVAREGAAA